MHCIGHSGALDLINYFDKKLSNHSKTCVLELSLCKQQVSKNSEENKIKIKSSLYSPCYAEACNELQGPSPRLSAWATQLRRNVATVASRWRHCADLTGPGIEPQTSRTESVRLATELTAGSVKKTSGNYYFEYCIVLLYIKKLKISIFLVD